MLSRISGVPFFGPFLFSSLKKRIHEWALRANPLYFEDVVSRPDLLQAQDFIVNEVRVGPIELEAFQAHLFGGDRGGVRGLPAIGAPEAEAIAAGWHDQSVALREFPDNFPLFGFQEPRFFQEALANTIRYIQANNVELRFRTTTIRQYGVDFESLRGAELCGRLNRQQVLSLLFHKILRSFANVRGCGSSERLGGRNSVSSSLVSSDLEATASSSSSRPDPSLKILGVDLKVVGNLDTKNKCDTAKLNALSQIIAERDPDIDSILSELPVFFFFGGFILFFIVLFLVCINLFRGGFIVIFITYSFALFFEGLRKFSIIFFG